MKTAQHLEGILQQKSVSFHENFRKIHQTAKISAQQRCHASRVFVTLPVSMAGIQSASQRASFYWLAPLTTQKKLASEKEICLSLDA